MQVLVFIGEDYYPKKHFNDLVYIFDHIPEIEELAKLAESLELSRRGTFEWSDVDWISLLIVDGINQPKKRMFELCNDAATAEKVLAEGYALPWKNSRGSWQGIQEVVPDNGDTDILWGSRDYIPKP